MPDSDTLFCSSCGAANLASANYCTRCGETLSTLKPVRPSAPAASSADGPPDETWGWRRDPAFDIEHPNFTAKDVDHSFAWALALSPLLATAINYVLYLQDIGQDYQYLGLAVTGAVTLALVLADWTRLPKGLRSPGQLLGFLLPPGYLFGRTRLLRSTYTLVIIWFVAFIAAVGTQTLVPSSSGSPLETSSVTGAVHIDSQRTETAIKKWAIKQIGSPTAINVSCPASISRPPGRTFTCDLTTGGEHADVIVTVANRRGDLTWVAEPR